MTKGSHYDTHQKEIEPFANGYRHLTRDAITILI